MPGPARISLLGAKELHLYSEKGLGNKLLNINHGTKIYSVTLTEGKRLSSTFFSADTR